LTGPMIEKTHILAEIRRTAEENGGKPLGKGRFAAETGIRETDWAGRYWARWGDAVREAGFQPNELRGRLDDESVFSQLAAEVRRVGRLPTSRELRLRRREDRSFPSAGVFDRLDTKRTLAAKLVDYCRDRPDLADVTAILEPLLAQEEAAPGRDRVEETEFGFVYLLKSGRYYKLGRTNSVGRREREFAIQLPERATRVHAIRTDDPAGIESYWHSRFADRRKNGEWFELTAADVSAFRRRKFM
jgi:Meiotically up-regulated gene 113